VPVSVQVPLIHSCGLPAIWQLRLRPCRRYCAKSCSVPTAPQWLETSQSREERKHRDFLGNLPTRPVPSCGAMPITELRHEPKLSTLTPARAIASLLQCLGRVYATPAIKYNYLRSTPGCTGTRQSASRESRIIPPTKTFSASELFCSALAPQLWPPQTQTST
jgi:hypothetical protein